MTNIICFLVGTLFSLTPIFTGTTAHIGSALGKVVGTGAAYATLENFIEGVGNYFWPQVEPDISSTTIIIVSSTLGAIIIGVIVVAVLIYCRTKLQYPRGAPQEAHELRPLNP